MDLVQIQKDRFGHFAPLPKIFNDFLWLFGWRPSPPFGQPGLPWSACFPVWLQEIVLLFNLCTPSSHQLLLLFFLCLSLPPPPPPSLCRASFCRHLAYFFLFLRLIVPSPLLFPYSHLHPVNGLSHPSCLALWRIAKGGTRKLVLLFSWTLTHLSKV